MSSISCVVNYITIVLIKEKRKWRHVCVFVKLTNCADERLRGLGTWKGLCAIGASLSAALSSLVSITCKAGGGLEGGGGGGALRLPKLSVFLFLSK